MHSEPVFYRQMGSFDEVVLPHLDAGYRLARWLLRNEADAEDAVQEATLKALRHFGTFRGGNPRAWFLTVVRNTCWRLRSSHIRCDVFNEEQHGQAQLAAEALLLRTDNVTLIQRAMQTLPARFRRLLALRELEGLSYRQLADAMDMPIGTVMSGLFRARRAYRRALDE